MQYAAVFLFFETGEHCAPEIDTTTVGSMYRYVVQVCEVQQVDLQYYHCN